MTILIKKFLIIERAKSAIKGEISIPKMPPLGSSSLIGPKIGSVTSKINLIIFRQRISLGLGLTQDIITLPIINKFKISKMALIVLAKINILLPPNLIFSFSKYCCADTDNSCPFFYSNLIIICHSH